MRRRLVFGPVIVVGLAAAVALFVSVASGAGHNDAAAVKVALVGNQPYGDIGPMDQMAVALAECGRRYGYDVRKFETLTPSSYAKDVRRVAQASRSRPRSSRGSCRRAIGPAQAGRT